MMDAEGPLGVTEFTRLAFCDHTEISLEEATPADNGEQIDGKTVITVNKW